MKRSDKTPNTLPRRTLLKGFAAGSLLPLLGGNLLGCSDSNDTYRAEDPGVAASFRHGIASGDPLTDRVIIWTRATPELDGLVRIRWEVAADEDFDTVVASGSGTTTAAVDYTVKVDVTGLTAGAVYWYRFSVGDTVSPIGRTRLPPAVTAETAAFAVVSCSNYPAGYFNVYREVAQADVDAVLHLGDYIYEYARDGYASDNAEALGRVVDPETEILSLSDYRRRYAQYRGDADLQAAHRAHPFIMVWDDHEIANDAWKAGAQNHDPATEGNFDERVAAALQAWYEWSPVRPPAGDREIIYRQFRYGDLVDLLMLDTRLIGRDRQLSYEEFSTAGMIDVASARAAIADPGRQLLGEDQEAWLRERLTNSTARWQVLGQQVLLGRYALPAPIIEALDPNNLSDEALQRGVAAVLQSVAAKNKSPGERTPDEQALLDSAIPYNLDAWDGYGYTRDALLDHVGAVDKRLVVLAGDTHNAWASRLRNSSGQTVGVEFGTPGVTSPGIEGALGADAAALLEGPIVTLIDDLDYANLRDRGYLVVSFGSESVTADWTYVSTIDSRDYAVQTDRARRLVVSADALTVAEAGS